MLLQRELFLRRPGLYTYVCRALALRTIPYGRNRSPCSYDFHLRSDFNDVRWGAS